jgi:hypothetical protein
MFVELHQTEKAVQFLINIAVPNYLQEDILSTVFELFVTRVKRGRTAVVIGALHECECSLNLDIIKEY